MAEAALTSVNGLRGEMGSLAAGNLPGQWRDEETVLLRHRGLSLSDIELGAAMLENPAWPEIGQKLRFA